MSTPIAAFDWNRAYFQHRDCLPHLRQSNVLYFLTFRLNDSLPASYVEKLRQARDHWLKLNPLPHSPKQLAQLHKLWTTPIERLLDASRGTCELRLPTARDLLEAALRYNDTQLYHLGDFVIMPNHVHALLHVPNPKALSPILQAWKSASSHNVNKLLHRSGTLWQPEPFDHIVRNLTHWRRFAHYIKKNPAHLPPNSYTLSHGSLPCPEFD